MTQYVLVPLDALKRLSSAIRPLDAVLASQVDEMVAGAREDVSETLYMALLRYGSHTCPVHRNEPCGLCLALAEYESRA